MTKQGDDLVSEYLTQVKSAAAGLPPRHREELLRDLREHIDTARRELPSESRVEIRGILDRLGDPFDIAEAAQDEHGLRRSNGESPARNKSFNYRKISMIIVGVIFVGLIVTTLFFLFFTGGSSPPIPGPGAHQSQ